MKTNVETLEKQLLITVQFETNQTNLIEGNNW